MNILITGASSGIGQQLAKDYLKLKHRAYLCGRNTKALDDLAAEFPQYAIAKTFDIENVGSCQKQLADIDEPDLIILNAGTCEYIDAAQFDAAVFERVIRTNLIGLGNCISATIPKIKNGGHLALMGSSSSFLPLPRAEAYGASKAATEYLAHTLGITLRDREISTTYIAPGFVKTPLSDLNDFPMPMRISVTTASETIRSGLSKRRKDIHFPKAFTWFLKCIAALPIGIQQLLIRKLLTST
jgi:short-subunit dehydrogenase